MKRFKTSTGRIALLLSFIAALLMAALIPAASANNNNGAIQKLFLAGRDITPFNSPPPYTTASYLNDLIPRRPGGPLTVFEPDSNEVTTAVWKSKPLDDAAVLLPGSVTLDLLVKNYLENLATVDVCFSKRIRLPGDVTTLPPLLVATGCFENPFPAVGPGTCPPSVISGGQSPPAAGCAPQGVFTMVATSTVLLDTTIPEGSVEELRIWCPGASFIGAFFNGRALGRFSTLTEPKCPAEDDNDNDGLNNSNESIFGTLVNIADTDLDGIPDGNDDANGNGEDDEDEDDNDDECPDPDRDNDGTDDEDEDD